MAHSAHRIQDEGGLSGPPSADQAALAGLFGKSGIHWDYSRQLCSIPAKVGVTSELLEYLLVAPHGAAHESLLLTDIQPSLLNTALLALGVEPGSNASWIPADPMPSEEELMAGASPYALTLPQGDGFYPYVAWREGEETYFYRLEDLLRNLASGRAMRRHRWVFLGSRMLPGRGSDADQEVFAADMEGNLINVAFFAQGNTLLTPALDACMEQTIWMGNAWLLPPRESPVEFILSRAPLETVPSGVRERLPLAVALPASSPHGAGGIGGGR
ncbi:MAG: YdjY domain-containing protein [Planctomycetota bacterium]|nr:YdjY domain-containing protein [Planctomycetota bacterium]